MRQPLVPQKDVIGFLDKQELHLITLIRRARGPFLWEKSREEDSQLGH